MKLFVIALFLINVVYFFLPGQATESVSDVFRGDRRVSLLVQLNENRDDLDVADVVGREYVQGDGAVKGVRLASAEGEVGLPSSVAVESSVLESSPVIGVEKKPETVAEEVCFTVGPFHRESKAELLTEALQSAGFKVDWRASKERRTRGYSVFLPSYPSYEAAETVVKKLSEHGVTDYYILTDSRRRNAVSLGFFTLKAGSEKRVNRLKQMGYSPQVEVRFDEVPVFWLDYESSSKVSSDAFWVKNPPADNLELLSRHCK